MARYRGPASLKRESPTRVHCILRRLESRFGEALGQPGVGFGAILALAGRAARPRPEVFDGACPEPFDFAQGMLCRRAQRKLCRRGSGCCKSRGHRGAEARCYPCRWDECISQGCFSSSPQPLPSPSPVPSFPARSSDRSQLLPVAQVLPLPARARRAPPRSCSATSLSRAISSSNIPKASNFTLMQSPRWTVSSFPLPTAFLS